jgi:hypothetical protein
MRLVRPGMSDPRCLLGAAHLGAWLTPMSRRLPLTVLNASRRTDGTSSGAR